MKKLMPAVCIIIYLMAISILPDRAQDIQVIFTPSSIDTFDGRVWSGIELGKSTRKDIQNRYRTGESGFDRAIRLVQPETSPLQIDILFSGKKSSAKASAIVLSYQSNGPSFSDLEAISGVPGEIRYASGRYQDWHVVSFRHKGIAALVINKDGTQTIKSIVLTIPNRLKSISSLSAKPTKIKVRNDPHADELNRMEFGTADASILFYGQSTPYNKEQFKLKEMLIEQNIRGASAGGTISYQPGAGGEYCVTVSINWDKEDGGEINIDCVLRGKTPYGSITKFSSGNKYISSTILSFDFDSELRSAMRKVEKSFEKTVLKQRPPSPAQLLEDSWKSIVNKLSK